MVKLVGVVKESESEECSPVRRCLARRQFPVEIEPELTMVMALDDSCVACAGGDKRTEPGTDVFLRNYKSLTKSELSQCLQVTGEEVTSTLSSLVSCVGCRRSVETLHQTLARSTDTSLEPLTVSSTGVISVNKEHISNEKSLTNLFCSQLGRLSEELATSQGSGGVKKQGRGGRCSLHSLEVKKTMTINTWLDTWEAMEQECRDEVVQLPYFSIKQTINKYLKKHKFCSDCAHMVKKCYWLLTEEEEQMYCGISVCSVDRHVHVRCDTSFIGNLFRLADLELSNMKHEKHVKNMEVAQKEVLTCIGLTLFERFQNIHQKMHEAEKTCDIMFMGILKSLRLKMDVAADQKRGKTDLDLLCEELEREDRKQERKREKKKNKKAKLREQKKAQSPNSDGDIPEEKIEMMEEEEDAEINDNEEKNGKMREQKKAQTPNSSDGDMDDDDAFINENEVKKNDVCDSPHKTTLKKYQADSVLRNDNVRPKCQLKMGECLNPHCNECLKPSLEQLLSDSEDLVEEEDDLIPRHEIEQFLRETRERRQQLRNNLKVKFAQMCSKANCKCMQV